MARVREVSLWLLLSVMYSEIDIAYQELERRTLERLERLPPDRVSDEVRLAFEVIAYARRGRDEDSPKDVHDFVARLDAGLLRRTPLQRALRYDLQGRFRDLCRQAVAADFGLELDPALPDISELGSVADMLKFLQQTGDQEALAALYKIYDTEPGPLPFMASIMEWLKRYDADWVGSQDWDT